VFKGTGQRASWAGLHRRSVSAIAIASLAIACTSRGGGQAGRDSGSVPVVTPSSVPFELDYAGQRSAFEAYVNCAAANGVEYEGPFTDSTGNSLFFRLAPGPSPSAAQRQRVSRACPQGIVGLYGTPIGGVHRASFERATSEFSRCLQTHGDAGFPAPSFDGDDPVATFWSLPFEWSSKRFTAAVKPCLDPLRSYLFAS
jgi:hypothetical protein